MGSHWRYPLDNNFTHQEILAEIVAHAISRIEVLKGKDSEAVLAEYKEWICEDYDNYVITTNQIQERLEWIILRFVEKLLKINQFFLSLLISFTSYTYLKNY